MATTWGAYDGHLRFGIDLTTTTPTASSTTVTVTVKLYIQVSDDYNFDDNQHWTLAGTNGSNGDFHNQLANNATKLLYSKSFGASIDYDGGPTYTYRATLSGAFNGASPTHSRSISLPKRPASAPSAPPAPTASAITATSVSLTWGAPATNGAPLTGNAGQVSTNSAFTNIIKSWSEAGWSGQVVTGLPKGTVLYARVRAQNSEGWSPWSAARQFETASTAAGAPTLSAITSITPTQATIAWTAPSDNGGETITGYQVQAATDDDFISGPPVQTKPTSPATVTGLLPGTTYYARVRAITAAGTGAWSAVKTFTTLSGVRVGTGTGWVPAIVWVGDGIRWVLATVRSGDGTRWR